MALSAKRRAFVEAYLRLWNATKAAEAAGYKHPRQAGSRLLSNVDIQAAIQARLVEMKMQADEVLVGFAEQARFDLLQFVDVDEEGRVAINLQRIRDAGLGHVVKKIYYDRNGQLVVEFHDAQIARRLIGQHHKLFTQKHVLEVPQLEPLADWLMQQIKQVYEKGEGDD